MVGEVAVFLEEAITQFEPDHSAQTRGRPRILPSLCLWAAMLVCMLDRQTSQMAIWRIIHDYGVFAYSAIGINDQTVYKRLEAEDEAPLQKLFFHKSSREE